TQPTGSAAPVTAMVANTPVSSAPMIPPIACTPKASNESSYPSPFFRLVLARKHSAPAAMPIMRAPLGSPNPEAGVTPTRPAAAPRADPGHGRLAFPQPLREHPGERCAGGGDLRRRHGHAGAHIGSHRRARVEAEPADPQQGSPDDGEHKVVRRERDLPVA